MGTGTLDVATTAVRDIERTLLAVGARIVSRETTPGAVGYTRLTVTADPAPTGLTPGARVRMIVAPGYTPVTYVIDVVAEGGKSLTAHHVDCPTEVELFTLRRNGHYARAGERQWSCYIRGDQ